ncbi:MAG: aquaporin family protein [Planctomyces sp.]|nr:aquaporin family protein [Planctomyces sp.]
MTPFIGELLGTTLLVTLGDGVVANVALARTKGHQGGWIVVTAGWGFAVAIAVYAAHAASGGHLNPAVTIGLAATGQFDWPLVPTYLAAQLLGGILGGVIVWLAYLNHWAATDDPDAKRAVFCTAPAIRSPAANLLTEIIGTCVLTLGTALILTPDNFKLDSGLDSSFRGLLVGLVVFSIGLSLGGPTGYAINPARDLGPRIAHALLPIPGKGPSDWGYAWVPVIGPLIGGVLGASLSLVL